MKTIDQTSNNWRNRLDELSQEPGTYNHTALWEKLEERLPVKKQTKRRWVYWAAAACIITALLLPLLMKNRQTNSKENTVKNDNNIKPGTSEKTVTNNSKNIKEKQPLELLANTRNHSIANKTVMLKPKIFVPVPLTTLQHIGTDTLAITKINSPVLPSNLSCTSLPAKKLTVLHVNELGKPVEEYIKMNSDDRSSLRLRFYKKDVTGLQKNKEVSAN